MRRTNMDTNQLFDSAVKYVTEELSKLKYPDEHPFNDYPKTPESMPLQMIIMIKIFTNSDDLVKSFLKKCKSVENNQFSYVKFNQNINEVIWFYYLYISLIENNGVDLLQNIYDEEFAVYDNGKKFEYSFLLNIPNENSKKIITSEVKTLTCDPFVKEDSLKLIDGQKLIKPLFPDLKYSKELSKDADAVILKSSTHYYQMEKNVKKIINKCKGNNLTDFLPFNIGIIFINNSTSFEEFYSYLFNSKRGFYDKLLNSNVDALVLISMDARNDLKLDNIYSMGYIQTVLINPSDDNKDLCKRLRIDNYIALGHKIDQKVYNLAQNEFGKYKLLCRNGFVNIIPADSTEDEIQEYLKFLNETSIRK